MPRSACRCNGVRQFTLRHTHSRDWNDFPQLERNQIPKPPSHSLLWVTRLALPYGQNSGSLDTIRTDGWLEEFIAEEVLPVRCWFLAVLR